MPAYALPANVLMRRLEDEAVLLDLDAGEYYGLDPIGIRLLDHLTTSVNGDLEPLAASLEADYATTQDVLRKDLEALKSELIDARLLVQAG